MNTPATSPDPPALSFSPWREAWQFAFALWGLALAALAVGILGIDARHAGGPDPFKELLRSATTFLPLLVFTAVVARRLGDGIERWMNPRGIVMLLTAATLIVLPVQRVIDVQMVVLTGPAPHRPFWDLVLSPPPMWIWFRFIFLLFGMAAVIAWSIWRANERRIRLWKHLEHDNLTLRLQILQGQLEPHFLFNTLNSIGALVRGPERAPAISALARLSELLRYSLRASKNPALSVQDEIGFIRDYLGLQELRFSDRLSVQWHIDDEPWQAIACPPLLLQPAIDAAIKAGVEAADGPCSIRVGISLKGANVFFELEMRSESAVTIPQAAEVQQIRDRLTLLYGNDATLVASHMPCGQRLQVLVPARELE